MSFFCLCTFSLFTNTKVGSLFKFFWIIRYCIHNASVFQFLSLTCQIRLFFHLFVICVRSWSTPSFMLLHHLHDGIIPTKHSVALITFIWIISALFVLPTVLLENSLVDFQACQLLPQNYGMVFYVVFLIFLLPSMVVTPILTRSTHMRYLPTVDYLLKPAGLCLQNNFFDYRKEFNIRRDISADFLDKEESEDEEEAEEIRVKMKISSRRNSELLHCSACSDSTLSLDRKPSQATLNFLKTDKQYGFGQPREFLEQSGWIWNFQCCSIVMVYFY